MLEGSWDPLFHPPWCVFCWFPVFVLLPAFSVPTDFVLCSECFGDTSVVDTGAWGVLFSATLPTTKFFCAVVSPAVLTEDHDLYMWCSPLLLCRPWIFHCGGLPLLSWIRSWCPSGLFPYGRCLPPGRFSEEERKCAFLLSVAQTSASSMSPWWGRPQDYLFLDLSFHLHLSRRWLGWWLYAAHLPWNFRDLKSSWLLHLRGHNLDSPSPHPQLANCSHFAKLVRCATT